MFWRRPHVCASIERIKALEEALLALEARHEALRGRFYAARMHKEADPPAPPAPKSKGEILREFGYQPGRPAPHRE